jgi:hypothetical protein
MPRLWDPDVFTAAQQKIVAAPETLTGADVQYLQEFGGPEIAARAVRARYKALEPLPSPTTDPLPSPQTIATITKTVMDQLHQELEEPLAEAIAVAVRMGMKSLTERASSLETSMQQLTTDMTALADRILNLEASIHASKVPQ